MIIYNQRCIILVRATECVILEQTPLLVREQIDQDRNALPLDCRNGGTQ